MKRVLIVLGSHFHRFENVSQEFTQRDAAGRGGEFVRFDARQVQDVAEQTKQVVSVALDR